MSQSITNSETLTSISNTATTYSSITVSSGVTLSIASEADNAINNSSQFSNFSTGTGVVINDNGGFENNTWGSTTLNGDGSLSIGATNTEALNNSEYGHILVGGGETITDAGGVDNSSNGYISLAGNGTLFIGNTSRNAFNNSNVGQITIGTGEIILDQGGLDNVGGAISLTGGGTLTVGSTDPHNAVNNSEGGYGASTIIAESGEVITDKGGFNNSNGGAIELAGATLTVAQDLESGNTSTYGTQSAIELTNGSTLAVGTIDNASGTISFYGSDNVLSYATLGTGLGTITSFGTGDTIALTGTSYASKDSLVSSGNVVSLVDGSNTLTSFNIVGGETFYLTHGASGEIEITNGPAATFGSGSSITSSQTLASINNYGSIISFSKDTAVSISSFSTDDLIDNINGGNFTASTGDIILDNGGLNNVTGSLTLMGSGTLALGETDANALNNAGGSILAGSGEVISDFGGLNNTNSGYISLSGEGSFSVQSTLGINNLNYGTIFAGAGEVISDQGGLTNSSYGEVSLAGDGTLSILGTVSSYDNDGNYNYYEEGVDNSNYGTLIAGADETLIVQNGVNNSNGGVFSLSGANATISGQLNNGSNGTINLADGSTLISSGGIDGSGGTIAFQGSGNDLAVWEEGQSYGTITGFGTGDVIDLTGSTYNSTDSLVVNGTVVSLVDTTIQSEYFGGPSNTYTTTLANFSTVTGESFTLIDGANGEIEIVCFLKGTHIATAQGAIEVQNLRAGDMVLTAQGEAKPIRWLGRSTISPRFADPLRAAPIRITAGALADNLPVRDLLVSPAHAMFIDGVLVQAGALVNGTSIRREAKGEDNFTYYHVELDSHDLILAENTACESFIDNIDRMNFNNWAERESSEPMVEMAYPRAKSARQVPSALRQQIAARATLTSPDTRVA